MKLLSFQNSYFEATHTLFALINSLIKSETLKKKTVYLSTYEESSRNLFKTALCRAIETVLFRAWLFHKIAQTYRNLNFLCNLHVFGPDQIKEDNHKMHFSFQSSLWVVLLQKQPLTFSEQLFEKISSLFSGNLEQLVENPKIISIS